MEGTYGVYLGKQLSGKVQVIRQGLYYRFYCRCQISGNVICRLMVTCADKQENLGVVVPVDGGFGLETKIPCKRLGEGQLQFTLMPKHSHSDGRFVPISPEEPFAYISRLKQAYLLRQGGQVGVMIKEPRECQ